MDDWIPACEQMPAPSELVLVSGHYKTIARFYELAKWEGDYWCDENGGALHRVYPDRVGPVTHWMTLPDHPRA